MHEQRLFTMVAILHHDGLRPLHAAISTIWKNDWQVQMRGGYSGANSMIEVVWDDEY